MVPILITFTVTSKQMILLIAVKVISLRIELDSVLMMKIVIHPIVQIGLVTAIVMMGHGDLF